MGMMSHSIRWALVKVLYSNVGNLASTFQSDGP